jgi:hypothetical protein
VRRQIWRSWWKADAVDAFRFQDVAERGRELRISVHQQVAFALEKAVKRFRQVSGNLLHPEFIRIRRAASEMNSSRGFPRGRCRKIRARENSAVITSRRTFLVIALVATHHS